MHLDKKTRSKLSIHIFCVENFVVLKDLGKEQNNSYVPGFKIFVTFPLFSPLGRQTFLGGDLFSTLKIFKHSYTITVFTFNLDCNRNCDVWL